MKYRRRVKSAGILVLILGSSLFCHAQSKTLTILHANDTHSNMFPFSTPGREGNAAWERGGYDLRFEIRPAGGRFIGPDSGGIARLSTLIHRLRAENGNVLALHAGDVFIGSFEFNKYLGYPEFRIMEDLYDAMTLGNHEFDLGLAGLAGVLSGKTAADRPTTLPILCANVEFGGTPLEEIVRKSIIKTVEGTKIGIFGIVTEDARHYSPEVAARMSGRVYEIAGEQAAALRAAGCEIVICLSHLGTTADFLGLGNVEGIDIIVGGHSHDAFEEPAIHNGKIIVQAGMFGLCLGELRVKIKGGAVSLDRYRLHAIDGTIREDPKLKVRLNALRQGVVEDPRFGPVYTQHIAWTEKDIEKSWPESGDFRDTPLGNVVTDAIMSGLKNAGVQADFALEALGYVAYKIPAGKIVANDILRAVPYGYDSSTGLGNKIVVVPLPGTLILGGLEYTLSTISYTKDLCMQVSGLSYVYDSTKPPSGQLGVLSRLDPTSVLAAGEPVAANPGKFYAVAMSEQVFAFLNALVAPMGMSLTVIPTGLSEYALVRDYMKELKRIDCRSEGRIRDMIR